MDQLNCRGILSTVFINNLFYGYVIEIISGHINNLKPQSNKYKDLFFVIKSTVGVLLKKVCKYWTWEINQQYFL